jgi:hypothetical protein
MKNFIINFAFLILFLALGNIQAQSPESMNYQAVIRDVSGNIIASQAVGVRITLLQGNASGTNVYRETFSPTTTAYGLISLKIGTGTVVSGTFATIDWGANSHYVETAVDIAGGTNYTVISTTQLMSVPYALYAKTSGNAIWQQDSISDINFGQGNVRIWETTEGLRLSVTGGTPLILKRNKSIANFGVPINFNLLNSSNEDTRYGQVVSSIRDNTAGAEFGSLSFLVADGSGTWSNGYAEERLRIETERVTVKNVMNLEPLNAAPSSPLEGDLYYDNAANQVKVYDGSSWVNLAGSSSPWTESSSKIFVTNLGKKVGIFNDDPKQELHIGSNSNVGSTHGHGSTILISGSGATPGSGSSSRIYFENTNSTDNKIAALAYGGSNLSFGTLSNSGSAWNGWIMTLNVDNKMVTVENTLKVEDSLSVNGKSIFSDLSGTGDRMVVANSTGTLTTQAIPSGSSSPWSSNANTNFTNKKVSVGHTNETYPLSVKSFHDGSISRGIDVLRTDNSGTNIGVPMSFSMLNSNNQPFEFAKLVGRTQINTSGAEIGSLSFQVADGTNWGQNYEQERMRIDNEMITVNAKNTASSDAIIRLKGTNANGSYSQLVDLKSTLDGHITSSKFVISTRNQGTMNDNFVVNSSGNVGIGTTSPTTLLQVSDQNAEGPTFKIDGLSPSILLQDNSGVSNTVDNFEIRNNLGNLQINYGDNADAIDDGFLSTNAFTISNIGQIGIGTTVPKERLQLGNKMFFHAEDVISAVMHNQFWNGSTWQYATNGYATGIEFNNNAIGQVAIWTATSGTAGSQLIPQARLLITNDGKIGVGTSTPAYKLDVNGDVNLTGSLRINGVAQTFGSGSSSSNATTFNYLSDGF